MMAAKKAAAGLARAAGGDTRGIPPQRTSAYALIKVDTRYRLFPFRAARSHQTATPGSDGSSSSLPPLPPPPPLLHPPPPPPPLAPASITARSSTPRYPGLVISPSVTPAAAFSTPLPFAPSSLEVSQTLSIHRHFAPSFPTNTGGLSDSFLLAAPHNPTIAGTPPASAAALGPERPLLGRRIGGNARFAPPPPPSFVVPRSAAKCGCWLTFDAGDHTLVTAVLRL
ncbi:hypothetical protein CDD80_2996 [Ophiocordyceps camponoti-rufipedis]|uniref:Uncharacterized protein n=1 Tax=Ophiocordyceps camponoti-rufipedis TaxID=2004952 RepID=A0A2C5Z3J3_9HYPO|nr:hypothetical protein CDD80_2996 [Ophiocordyceps camponoti-rufipedis]